MLGLQKDVGDEGKRAIKGDLGRVTRAAVWMVVPCSDMGKTVEEQMDEL